MFLKLMLQILEVVFLYFWGYANGQMCKEHMELENNNLIQ